LGASQYSEPGMKWQAVEKGGEIHVLAVALAIDTQGAQR
jgi:hypothetical protein